jgi:hypothetical protein
MLMSILVLPPFVKIDSWVLACLVSVYAVYWRCIIHGLRHVGTTAFKPIYTVTYCPLIDI